MIPLWLSGVIILTIWGIGALIVTRARRRREREELRRFYQRYTDIFGPYNGKG